ncbi:cytochrome c oxidase subunit II [Nitratireductor sp. GISD-1A_MAKvit]|uniref:cytochrome c oxidase subunit II n=1 Tax=Nitratireductor sp. GISD-1A_MAKvit TaxID=3234198 RepID=UPI0034678A7E
MLVVSVAALASGCAGVQSALQPAGREAVEVNQLFITVTVVSIIVTAVVLIALALAMWGPERWRSRLGKDWLIIGGGIVFPVIVLSALLAYGLVVMNAGASRANRAEGQAITITGKQWWWEVIYTTDDGKRVVSANELRLPVGKPVALHLKSSDVIHSFWAPRLAGKLDMIPGRTNTLTVEATEAGISRGQCAEYCGGAHALMSFYVVAMPPAEFDAWLESEAEDATEPQGDLARRGQSHFMENGCGGCHTIRGTSATGMIGPDLTHLASRHSLGAATLPNNARMIARWIGEHQHIKPDNHMPPYENLSEDELFAISAYLEGLD